MAENFRWLEAARIRREHPPFAIEGRKRMVDFWIIELWRKRLESDPKTSVLVV